VNTAHSQLQISSRRTIVRRVISDIRWIFHPRAPLKQPCLFLFTMMST
jgi:hypothetical protein